MEFRKATKLKAKLRMTIPGPAGAGKTFTALKIATAMGGRTAAIDTEHGALSKYGHVFDVDVVELEDHAPNTYVKAIELAAKAGYDNLVIDSLSHEWIGTGGALEMADKATAASRSKNSFNAWGKVTPEHNKVIEAIVASPCHVIATMRSKSDYIQRHGSDGKTEIQKVGMAPMQRDGMEFEFDVIGEMDMDHVMTIVKSRVLDEHGNNILDGCSFPKPGEEFAHIILDWLDRGAEIPRVTEEEASTIRDWLEATGANEEAFLAHFRIRQVADMSPKQYPQAVAMLKKKAEQVKAKAEAPKEEAAA